MAPIPLNPRFVDITGQVFGRWTVTGYAGSRMWHCRCSCGSEKPVYGPSLTRDVSTSCGCRTIDRNFVHGESSRLTRTPEYTAYYGARDRCINPANRQYSYYGGRGIEFRFGSYTQFLQAVGRRPTRHHSIDRIDTNGHYEPGNLRWATIQEQNRNVRRNIMLTVDGVERCLPEWADLYGISKQTLKHRYDAGWCHTCAVSLPVGQKGSKGCLHRATSCR